MLATDKQTDKIKKVSTFSDSDFLRFLENNFPGDFFKITSEGISDEAIYSILQRHNERYRIWQKIPEWIKDFYGDKLPAEVFTIHEPYQDFICSLELVVKMSPVYDYSCINTTIFNSEYAKKVYEKYSEAGYNEASIAKMIVVSEKDKELFDSGKIHTEEGKFLHKVNHVEKFNIIEEAMTSDEDVLHSLKELRRIEAKLNKVTDEAEKAKLQNERNELVLYLAKGVSDLSDTEFVEALSGALEKLYDKDATSQDVSDAIKNVRSKLKGKNKGEFKKEGVSEEKGVDKETEEVKKQSKNADTDLSKELKGAEKEKAKKECSKKVANVLALLSKHDTSGQMSAILKDAGSKGFKHVRSRLGEVAPKPGYFARKLKERHFSKDELPIVERVMKGEEVDLSFLKDKKIEDEKKKKILASLMRIHGDKKSAVDDKKDENVAVTKVIANKSNIDLSL